MAFGLSGRRPGRFLNFKGSAGGKTARKTIRSAPEGAQAILKAEPLRGLSKRPSFTKPDTGRG
jgi:hypothetical protein